jgi:hypothetical protein
MKQEQAVEPQAKRRQTKVFSAKEKAQAVLALWSGRRNPSTLTRELEVPWAIINTWEKRALSGMLTALDPTWKQAQEEQPTLPRRLERLIEQTLNPTAVSEPAASN